MANEPMKKRSDDGTPLAGETKNFSNDIPQQTPEVPLFYDPQGELVFKKKVQAIIDAQPNSYAYGTGGGNIAAASVSTKVNINSNVLSSGITYDGTGKNYVVTTAGNYEVSAQANYANPSASGKSFQVQIYTATALTFIGFQVSTAGLTCNPIIPPRIVTLAVGDTIELYGQTNSASIETMTTGSITIRKVS